VAGVWLGRVGSLASLARTNGVGDAADYRLVDVKVAIPDFDVVAALRIGADPGLVVNSCALAAKIGQRYQVAFVTLAALRKRRFHVFPPPILLIELADCITNPMVWQYAPLTALTLAFAL